MKAIHTEDYIKRRRESYPDVGDQLDILWKTIQHIHDSGVVIPDEAIAALSKITEVKKTFHKPVKK